MTRILTAIVVPTTGPCEIVRVRSDLRWLQRTVDRESARAEHGASAAYVDHVHFGNDVGAYVHDEGLLIGLPINWRITALRDAAYGAHTLRPQRMHPLVGPAVVVGENRDDGEDHDAPEPWQQALLDAPSMPGEAPFGGAWSELLVHLAVQYQRQVDGLPLLDFHCAVDR